MKTPLFKGNCLLLIMNIAAISLFAQRTPQQIEEIKRKIYADPVVKNVSISPLTQSPVLIQMDHKRMTYDRSTAKQKLENFLELRLGIDALQLDKQVYTTTLEVQEYQQYYKGIKVDRSKFKAFFNYGNVTMYSGSWFQVPNTLETRPLLTAEQALAYAKRRVNAKKYAEEEIREKINAATDLRLKDALAKELAEVTSKGELVIIKDFTKQGVAEMRLAYKFNIYAAEPLSRGWVYVDAQNGKILLYDAIIKHADGTSVSTTVKTRYAGERQIKTKLISGLDPHSGGLLVSSHPTTEIYIPGTATWTLIDDSRGKGIETYDMNGVGGLPLNIPYLYIQGKSFTDVDNNWTLSEHKRSDPLQNGTGEQGAFEAENDDIAWDAHWGAGIVYDYWLNHHNRRSFDDRDSKIKSFVHYGPAYDNAFWNGSYMTYGDGSGTATPLGYKALTSLDVCGHEIGHGICSYTSDLVYEKESGAMNEALSDIWAACVEHYAIRSVDNAFANIYRPFYIGEQIGATYDNPLRRMDNPKAAGNPDTYGGENWSNPDCAPDLANDYCGVHNNSGVLNKWFYLITVGSHNGSGPDGQYARADSDDGINDLGNAYSVTGIGFELSEKIAYMMELMLSSTATYAEAREASIAAATVISGDACSPAVQSVMNAWYAVGVGSQYNGASCTSTYGFVFQPGITINEGDAGAGCDAEKEYKIKVLLPASSSATITASGSASNNLDYRLPITTLSNTTSANKIVDLSVFIKNDAIVEANEIINLSIAIINAGNLLVNNNYTININEDDITPIIGSGSRTLTGSNFDGIANGFNLPSGWNVSSEVVSDNNWGVWDGQLKITPLVSGVQLLPGTYNSASPASTIASAPIIDAAGLNKLRIKFDYRVQGEVDANGLNPENFGVFDYMAVVYSYDGINFTELNVTSDGFGPFCSLTPTSGSFDMALPAFLANKRFYIGFKWFNDTNAGGPESVSIDNFSVTGESKTIENDLGNNSREMVLAGQSVNFYSVQDGEVIANINNNSGKSFGCTNAYIERAGNGAFNLYYGNDGLHKVADKVVRVEPSLIYKASTSFSFYYTEAELKALELATNRSRSSFLVYHVSAASYTGAASNNTRKYQPTYTEIPGAGGIFTFTINDKPIGSFALGCATSILGLRQSVTDVENIKVAPKAQLYPNPASTISNLQITAVESSNFRIDVLDSKGQVVMSQRQSLAKGTSTVMLNIGRLSSGTYQVRVTNDKGILISTNQLIKQ